MEKEEYKYEPHQFVFWKAAGKHYCVWCGLVALNNPYSEWAVEKGCLNKLHTSHNNTRRKFTKLKGI
jgi:hypothetical protein